MTAREEAILNMFREVNQVGIDNNGFITGIPMLDASFTDLKNRILKITGLASLQASVRSGIAIDKLHLKYKMARLTYYYSGAGRAWAAMNDDDQNYEAMNLSEYTLKKARDEKAGGEPAG